MKYLPLFSTNIATPLASLFVLFALTLSQSPRADSAHWSVDGVNAPQPFAQRQSSALTGSEFLRKTDGLSWADRERAILAQIRAGNVPSHIRALVPVQIAHGEHRATIFVVPDYLAIGSDDDYVIIPMAPRTAMKIAREYSYILPSRKMVDDIYQHSTVHLTPEPMRPGPAMTSNAYYAEHDDRIKAQLPDDNGAHPLIAGHKKDVVVTPKLQAQPGKLAIYGWHRAEGDPIQPLSLYHGVEYVDYSHGARLISRVAMVNGKWVDLTRIYSDPELNPLISDEGALPTQSYL